MRLWSTQAPFNLAQKIPLLTGHQITARSGGALTKFIWSAVAFRVVSLRIGSRLNTNSEPPLVSYETGMGFNNDIARTRETGIDIQHTAKRKRETQ